ncbi:hypothetical protein [Rhizorhabdus sp.]|uniref:hypothetical protein n=1 Tax=Rhizorhabdus sp. TaxID=1968843 RepID=UPI0035B29199
MPIPPNATIWAEQADPRDVNNWKINCTVSLAADEAIESYELMLGAEAVAAGLIISAETARQPALVEAGKVIQLWLSVDPAMRLDPIFEGAGVTLPIEVTLTTNSIPSRTIQRTVAVRIAQQ